MIRRRVERVQGVRIEWVGWMMTGDGGRWFSQASPLILQYKVLLLIVGVKPRVCSQFTKNLADARTLNIF